MHTHRKLIVRTVEEKKKREGRKKSTSSDGEACKGDQNSDQMSHPGVSAFFYVFFCVSAKGTGRIRDLIPVLFTLGTIGDV